MAITFNTDRLQGLEGTTINGVYGRIQSVTVKKYDATTDPDVAANFKIMYDVVLHASAVKRNADGEYPEWSNRLNSRQIDHFTCTYDPTSNANPYAQAYADLKAKLAAGGSPIASSIQDA
jgi:hypothetical protein